MTVFKISMSPKRMVLITNPVGMTVPMVFVGASLHNRARSTARLEYSPPAQAPNPTRRVPASSRQLSSRKSQEPSTWPSNISMARFVISYEFAKFIVAEAYSRWTSQSGCTMADTPWGLGTANLT